MMKEKAFLLAGFVCISSSHNKDCNSNPLSSTPRPAPASAFGAAASRIRITRCIFIQSPTEGWFTRQRDGKKVEFYIPSSSFFKDLGTFYRTGIERLESGNPGRRHIPGVPVGRMKGPSRRSFQLIQPRSSSPALQTIPLVNCWHGNSLSLLLVYCRRGDSRHCA